MAWSDYKYDVAPNLKRLAQSSATYTEFYSISSFTSQTIGGFLGGRYPSELKRSGYFFSRYPDEELFFPELLQKAGARTMSGQAHWYFGKEKANLHQGFDVWDLVPGIKKSNTTDENVTGPKHLAMALRHLSNPDNVSGQFFALYHFMDPHDMYMGHAGIPKMGRGARGMYNGEIRFTDQLLGKLIDFVDAQPWGKRTAIVVTADHGETFGEHGMYRHGFELWQELVRVPLIVRIPGVKPRRIAVPRSGIDLAPTILELMGVKPDPRFQGKSLVAELRGAEASVRPVLSDLSRTSDNDRRRALVYKGHKLIAYGDDDSFRLYNLKEDPKEKRNLASKKPELLKEMIGHYRAVGKTIKEVCPKMTSKLRGKKKRNPC